MTGEARGHDLALGLLAAFRALVDDLHAELAARGHPQARPAHGFALQAVKAGAGSAVDLARALGVSKQAAGQTLGRLEALGYVARAADPRDGRRRVVALRPKGRELLALSAEIFDALRADWADRIGLDRLQALEADLRRVTEGRGPGLDMQGWLGGDR